LDEPTDGLDPNQKHEVRTLLTEMAKDKAILISTHILEEVEAVCTRAIIISQGKILFDDTPQALEKMAPRRNSISLVLEDTESGAATSKLEQLDSVKTVTTEQANGQTRFVITPKSGQSIVKEIAHLCREQNWTVDDMHVEPVRLDDVFRMVTQGGHTETEVRT
jgi:ABC-2 type transport system ATP-binding protein